MAGNKQREKAANLKLVAENEHLLPRVKGSEKIAAEATEAEEPLAEELVVEIPAQKLAKVKKLKQRLMVNGGVEDRMDVD